MSDFDTKDLEAKVVISGTLVYTDKDGQVVGTADFTMTPDQIDAETMKDEQ